MAHLDSLLKRGTGRSYLPSKFQQRLGAQKCRGGRERKKSVPNYTSLRSTKVGSVLVRVPVHESCRANFCCCCCCWKLWSVFCGDVEKREREWCNPPSLQIPKTRRLNLLNTHNYMVYLLQRLKMRVFVSVINVSPGIFWVVKNNFLLLHVLKMYIFGGISPFQFSWWNSIRKECIEERF